MDFRAVRALSFQIEVSQIVIHKAHQPDIVVHFFDADGLTGKDLTEIDFLLAQTDAAATGDHDGFIVQGIVDVLQSTVGTQRRLVDLRRTLHVESFVRTFVVEDVDKFFKAGLLLKKIGGGWLGGLFLRSQMPALMTAILLLLKLNNA